MASRIRRLVRRTPCDACCVMRPASSRADAISCSCGTTRETRFQASACCASIMSPVNASSAARDMPTIRGSSQAPPSPGMIPSLMKLSANLAFSEAMRMSHIQARSSPAPMAWPLTAAITGTSRLKSPSVKRWMPRRYSCRMSISLTSGVAWRFMSRMSPPAQNEGPFPVSMTQRTCRSSWIRSMAARNSGTALLPVSGLRCSGWSMVKVTTGPSCW